MRKSASATGRSALTFTGLVMREERGFWSLCPELDVASEGETAREARAMLREAVGDYLETCFESNLPFLRPVPVSEDPRNSCPEEIVSTFRLRVDVAVKVRA